MLIFLIILVVTLVFNRDCVTAYRECLQSLVFLSPFL